MYFITHTLEKQIVQDFHQHIKQVKLKKNTRFSPQLHYPQHVIFSTSGAFSLIKPSLKGREKVLYILGADEMLSTFPISIRDQSEFCKSLIESEISLIPQDIFQQFLIQNPIAALNLIAYQEKMLARLKRQIKNFNLPIKDRILARLWKLAYDFGNPVEKSWITIQIPLSMQLLADFIGSNRETVSRLMHELQCDGYIQINQKYISIQIDFTSEYLKLIK